MPIQNICAKCGRKIHTRTPNDPFLANILKTTNLAMCKICEPRSSWALVNPVIHNEGKVDYWSYSEIITDDGIGLLLKTKKKEIYFPPHASKTDLKKAFYSLPEHIRDHIIEYPLIKKIFE